jgi:NAD+ synthase
MNTEQLAEKLVNWIRDEVTSAACKGAVLGMSGGVDSSVAAVLCKRAFPESTLGLIMPCHSIPGDKEHALAVARKFSIPIQEVVLDSVFDTLKNVLPDHNTETTTDRLAQANLKVRLRMLTLYYFANQLTYMVVGSSNKAELSVGYFTKYGDGGVDILPLGNLLKREVKELAGFLGIPQEIIDKPPSAGLWPGQTDEADIGFSYDQLDSYLSAGEAPDEVKLKIKSRISAHHHKRMPPRLPGF